MGKVIRSISGASTGPFDRVRETQKFTREFSSRPTKVVYVPVSQDSSIGPELSSRITALPAPKPQVTTPPVEKPPESKPQEVTPQVKLSPEAERQKKIKSLVSDTIVALGLTLLAVGVCVIAAHALGGSTMDSNQLQTIIMCGFGLIAGGLSLPNTDYKGSVSVGGGALPFRFDLVEKKQ